MRVWLTLTGRTLNSPTRMELDFCKHQEIYLSKEEERAPFQKEMTWTLIPKEYKTLCGTKDGIVERAEIS